MVSAGSLIDDSGNTTPRWTILAEPTTVEPIRAPADLDRLLCTSPVPSPDAGPTARADRATPAAAGSPDRGPCDRGAPDERTPPFRAGRLLAMTYELGHALEPKAMARDYADRADQPLGYVIECPRTWAYDHARCAWTAAPASLPPAGPPLDERPAFALGALESEMGERVYREIVREALGLINAGDVYQVNLAHRLRARFEGSPRALAASLFSSAAPAHGFYAELPTPDGMAICSASPELFLSFDPLTRTVRTRPMKGTRPISGDAEELRAAEKDRAELDMITDLMRNDLGRVCAFGSVRVDRARTIEAHGGSVWQATSTISGTLREGLTPADLVRATFPPGSVTGAPKVRAMQIIDELETTPRGYYCGALGWVDDSGGMSLNVAIRTASITGDTLTYHAGAGIVADSDPAEEWAETLAKAAIVSGCASSPR